MLGRTTLARFEEVTRCPQEVQDALISLMSEKQVMIPELSQLGAAQPGFNLIATANLNDKGVNEMSSALKRRFNFETVHPIKDIELEKTLVKNQVKQKLQQQSLDIEVDLDLLDVLISAFDELRNQKSSATKALDAVLSSAEAVNIAYACTLQNHYMNTPPECGQIAQQMQGTIIKDKQGDRKKLAHYLDVFVRDRAKRDPRWQAFFAAGKDLWMS